ncbi:MAG: ABC transporter substrate-binding protein [Thermodesulfobacteriota bacterium]
MTKTITTPSLCFEHRAIRLLCLFRISDFDIPIWLRRQALIGLAVIFLGLALGSSVEAGEVSIVDDFGHTVTLPSPARRIIALYGAYNEILGAMGLEGRIVGRTKADRLPPSILSSPSIGTHMRPSVEIILALKPDLILQSAGRREAVVAVEQLRKKGIPLALFNPENLEGLVSVIRRMGVLTGEEQAAGRLIQSMQERLARVESLLQGVKDRPRVFFEVRYPNLLAAGRGSIVHDIIQRAGGVNCLEDRKRMVRIGMESLIQRNPAAYVVQKGPMNRNPSPPWERPHFGVLDAVKKRRVLFVDEQIFSRPGPRSVDAVESLAAFLHPDRF